MKKYIFFIFIILFLLHLGASSQDNMLERRKAIANQLSGTLGSYAAPPLLQDGKIDYKLLIKQLKDIHANTYHWLDRMGNYDIDALKVFLPLAKKAKLNVWVTLVPPSEPPPSDPYKLDFMQWSIALATLSLEHSNLVAWSIDDFVHNLNLFTPTYVKAFLDSSHKINPSFAFFPCCYYAKITDKFVKEYGPLLDGILFPYRNESVVPNLKDAGQVKPEIEKLRTKFDQGFLIFLDIYASHHSQLGPSTPQYVKDVLESGLESADGVFIYRHQDPIKEPEKYAIIKAGFKTKQKVLMKK